MRQRDLVEAQYAEFYDLFVGDFQLDIPIYLDLASKYPGPVLEVGCGTGRVLRQLARTGQELHGVDVERAMIELARRWFRERPELPVRISYHDLRHEGLRERYHVALVTLHAINTLIDIEEQRRFLRNLRTSLREPAVIAFDCFCPMALVRSETSGEWRAIERSFGERRVSLRDKREMLTPLLERRTQVFKVDDAPEAQIVQHRRYVPPTQLAGLLAEAGFESARWIEKYDPSTARPAESDDFPVGPYLMLAEI
jgi:SAM-dependent methyltransferase